MTVRPIFISTNDSRLVGQENIQFEWYPEFAVVQKQKSIKSLHDEALKKLITLKYWRYLVSLRIC